MVAWWQQTGVDADDLLLACTHPDAAEFAAVAHPHKVRVRDPRLATRDHARERQSYSGVLAAAADWLRARETSSVAGFGAVHLAEYDHLPLAPDLGDRLLGALREEGADVLGHELRRVDGTNQPHHLYHLTQAGGAEFWARTTRRRDEDARRVVLSMFGSGSLWTPAALAAVAALPEPFPIYLELWLPTAAHHLGFRVRPFPAAAGGARFISSLGNRGAEVDAARAAGAWTLHPVKTWWDRSAGR